MKSADQTLIDMLAATRAFIMAELYTFTLGDQTALRFSGLDTDVTTGGETYSSRGLRFKRSKLSQPKGIQLSALEVDIAADSTAFVGSTAFLPFAAAGGLDGATMTVARLITPLDVAGYTPVAVTIFSGRVADCEIGRTSAKVMVKSWPELLDIMMPRRMFQAPCVHTLYDAGCALAKANFAVAGCSVYQTSTQTVINASVPSGAGDYFSLGEIVFTSGANQGLTRTVKTFSNPGVAGEPSIFTLVYPLPQAPAVGDTFTAYPGCDKQQATCQSKFNNLANFLGFPYVPNMETSI